MYQNLGMANYHEEYLIETEEWEGKREIKYEDAINMRWQLKKSGWEKHPLIYFLEDMDDYEERDDYMWFFNIRLNDCLNIRLETQKNKNNYKQVIEEINITPSYFVSYIFKGGCEFLKLKNHYEEKKYKSIYDQVMKELKFK
jgi:hypothetical protein